MSTLTELIVLASIIFLTIMIIACIYSERYRKRIDELALANTKLRHETIRLTDEIEWRRCCVRVMSRLWNEYGHMTQVPINGEFYDAIDVARKQHRDNDSNILLKVLQYMQLKSEQLDYTKHKKQNEQNT